MADQTNMTGALTGFLLDVLRQRTPRENADALGVRDIAQRGEYIYDTVGMAPWIQTIQPVRVIDVERNDDGTPRDTWRCSVDVSGDKIDNVRYTAHTKPQPDETYLLRETLDRDNNVVERWIKVPQDEEQQWIYYPLFLSDFGDNSAVARVAWPPPDGDVASPADIQAWLDTAQFVCFSGSSANVFVGVDGVGRVWFFNTQAGGVTGVIPTFDRSVAPTDIKVVTMPPVSSVFTRPWRVLGVDATPGKEAGILAQAIITTRANEVRGHVGWGSFRDAVLRSHFGDDDYYTWRPDRGPGAFDLHNPCLIFNDLGTVSAGAGEACPDPVCTHGDAHMDFYDCIHNVNKELAPEIRVDKEAEVQFWLYNNDTWGHVATAVVEGDGLYTPALYVYYAIDPSGIDDASLALYGPTPADSGNIAPIEYERDAVIDYLMYGACSPVHDPAESSRLLNSTISTNGHNDILYMHQTFSGMFQTRNLPRQGFCWTETDAAGNDRLRWLTGYRLYTDIENGLHGPLFFADNAYMRSIGIDAPDSPGYRGNFGRWRPQWREIPNNKLRIDMGEGMPVDYSTGRFVTGFWAAGANPSGGEPQLVSAWDNALSGLESISFRQELDLLPAPEPLQVIKKGSTWEDIGLARASLVYAQGREITTMLMFYKFADNPSSGTGLKWTDDTGGTWHTVPNNALPGLTGLVWDAHSPGYIVLESI
jgi:hypothetical protein